MTASFNLHAAFTCTIIQFLTVPLIYFFASGSQSPGATSREASPFESRHPEYQHAHGNRVTSASGFTCLNAMLRETPISLGPLGQFGIRMLCIVRDLRAITSLAKTPTSLPRPYSGGHRRSAQEQATLNTEQAFCETIGISRLCVPQARRGHLDLQSISEEEWLISANPIGAGVSQPKFHFFKSLILSLAYSGTLCTSSYPRCDPHHSGDHIYQSQKRQMSLFPPKPTSDRHLAAPAPKRSFGHRLLPKFPLHRSWRAKMTCQQPLETTQTRGPLQLRLRRGGILASLDL